MKSTRSALPGMALLAIRWALASATALVVETAASPQSAAEEENQAPASKVEPAPGATPNAQQDEPAFRNRTDKLSYAFGVDLARDLKRQRIDVNVDVMVRALRDALAGNKLIMTDEEVVRTLKTYDEERKRDLAHAKAMLSEKNKRAAEEFVAKNVKKDGVVTLPSGLQYKILKQGNGETPTLEDTVECHYRGTLLDGTEFDSSYKRNQPATVPVKGLIKGWSEALQLMPVGSKWQIFVPPHLGYGERVVGGIPPNAMLVFDIEVISIQAKPQTVSALKSP